MYDIKAVRQDVYIKTRARLAALIYTHKLWTHKGLNSMIDDVDDTAGPWFVSVNKTVFDESKGCIRYEVDL